MIDRFGTRVWSKRNIIHGNPICVTLSACLSSAWVCFGVNRSFVYLSLRFVSVLVCRSSNTRRKKRAPEERSTSARRARTRGSDRERMPTATETCKQFSVIRACCFENRKGEPEATFRLDETCIIQVRPFVSRNNALRSRKTVCTALARVRSRELALVEHSSSTRLALVFFLGKYICF